MMEGVTMKRGTVLVGALVLLFAAPEAEGAPAQRDKVKVEKIVWGKEVNGLAVAIAPARDGAGRRIVRWKNVGKETLELPWVRFGSDRVYKHLDDLLNHVSLKKPDGKLVPARQYKVPGIGGPPYRPRTVIVEPGKMHQETIDLWAYVEKPALKGNYQLWIDLNIRSGYAPSRPGAKYWTGKVRSNALEVKLGK
jgi:hypothetical protein